MLLMTYGAERCAAGKHIRMVEQIRGWYDDKDDLPAARMAKCLRISLPVFEGVLSLIKEHPDWDDEEIADKADWS